jgi:hypothetical protein
MVVCLTLSDQIPEASHVYPQGCTSTLLTGQSHLIAVYRQAARAKFSIEHRQIAAQVGKGQRIGSLGPKEGRKRLPPVGLIGDGQIRQQRQSLAAAELDRRAISLQAWWAK